MQPGNQPVGNPPPGYRYRVVEIPLDQVFADSMSSLAGFGEEGTELQYRQYVQQLQQAGLEEYLRQQYLDPQLQQAMMQQQILQQQLMQQQMMQQQMMQQEQMAAAGLGERTWYPADERTPSRRRRSEGDDRLDFPNLVIQPENFLTKSLVLKEPDRRLLVQASQEMFRALQLPSSQYRDRADQLVSMVKAVAGLNWLDFFTEVTQHSVPRLTYTMVRLVNGPYLTTLNAFLDAQAYPTGNRDNLLDYVRLLIFLNFAVSLPSLPQLNEVYWRYGHDMHKAPERWRLCLRFIDEILPRALSWFYHRYHLTLRVAKEPFTVLLTPLTQGTVQEHLETVEALKDVFGIFLGNADWLPYNMRIDGSTKCGVCKRIPLFQTQIDVDGNNIAKAAVEARKVEVSDYYNYSIFLEKGEQFG
ncbi:hypothetical protein V5799_019423 [Amblyomma americanum]|uniref:Uncharacterized protein n=1 Tax=Amblyomma americanum TaxID=6943 RepID=A0AAQ4EWZ6_AMBAM